MIHECEKERCFYEATPLSWKNLSGMNKNCGQMKINKITLKDCGERHKNLGRFCSSDCFSAVFGFLSFLKKLEPENHSRFLVYTGHWDLQRVGDKALLLCQICE